MTVKHEWTLLNLAYCVDWANRATQEKTEIEIKGFLRKNIKFFPFPSFSFVYVAKIQYHTSIY